MKRFRFRLESVLTLRGWAEQRARQAYSHAQAECRKLEEALAEIDRRLEEAAREDLAGRSGAFQPGDPIRRWNHVQQLRGERVSIEEKLNEARRDREKKMAALLEARRQLQILEKLKEKKHEEFIKEVQRFEEKELDDLVNARFSTSQNPS